YLMYENGWNSFFDSMAMDYFIIFWLLVSIPMIFGSDYDTEMYRINRTTANGDGRIYFGRVFIGSLFPVVITLFSIMENLFAMHIKYGLYNWEYPLQSLSIFKNTPWNCSIGDAVVMCFVLALTGAVFFSVVIMLSSVLFKKNLYAIIVAVAVCLLPAFMLKEEIFYNLAFLPASYMHKQGYIFGYTDMNGNEVVYGMADIFMRICVSAVFMALYVLAGFAVYCGKNIRRFIQKSITIKKGACVMVCFICLMPCSCGKTQTDTPVTSNINRAGFYNRDGDIINVAVSPFRIIRNGESKDLFVDPFMARIDINTITFLNLDGENLYYLASRDGEENMLCRINVRTCETEDVYSHYTDKVKGYDYLGLHNNDGGLHHENKWMNEVRYGWVDGEYYYYVRRDRIIKCNLTTKKEKAILAHVNSEIGYSDGYILYVDEQDYNMWMYDVENDSRSMVSEDSCMHILAMKDGFLVQNGNRQLLYINCETSGVTVLRDNVAGHISTMDGKYVYCICDNKIVRYNYTDDNQTEDVIECAAPVDGVIAGQPDGNIYVNVSGGEELKMYMFDDGEWESFNH
ncbi:MAG: hypothetical protein HFH14_00420, partial [Lachnospiraceae bacterium]|nr:hypothetical protein [Lachnospiraceae bacterium]